MVQPRKKDLPYEKHCGLSEDPPTAKKNMKYVLGKPILCIDSIKIIVSKCNKSNMFDFYGVQENPFENILFPKKHRSYNSWSNCTRLTQLVGYNQR